MPAQTQAVWDATEVTQSVQDLQHSVTLIADKVTVIRVYVSGTIGEILSARGAVKLRRSPTVPPLTLTSLNVVSLDPAENQDLATRRADERLSLNFLLPSTLTAEGPLQVSELILSEVLTGAAIPIGGAAVGPTVWFHPAPPLRIRVFGLRYRKGNPPTTYTPRELDHAALVSWLKRAYPVPDVISSRTVIDVVAPAPFTCEDTNAQLAAIRALDISAGGDPRTHYLGQAADGGFFMRGCSSGVPAAPDPATVASSPCGAADWGWDFDGAYSDWYGGHELGHTFGRRHPGFCGESPDDLQNYPFQKGQLADSPDTFVGFDVGDLALNLPMKVRPGVQWHDVMTYCNQQWISSYTYEAIRRRLMAENALTAGAPVPEGSTATPAPLPEGAPAPLPVVPVAGSAGPAAPTGGRPDERFPQLSVTRAAAPEAGMIARAGGALAGAEQLVSVVGTVNLTRREGGIRFVNPVSPLAAQPAVSGEPGPNGETPVVLRIKQADGGAPREVPVPVKLASELAPGADRTGLVDAVVPVGPSPAAIELVVGGQVVDAFRAAGAPPALRTARHAGADNGAFGLALDFDKAPEPGQTFAAQVSTDDGGTWQTVGVGLKDPVIQVDHSQFRPGQQVQLRIISTNGFTSTVADIQQIQV